VSRIVTRIDEQGNYVEDVLVDDLAPTPEGCINQRPPSGARFHRPGWTGSELEGLDGWVEGKPESEIVEAIKGTKTNEFAARAVEDLAPLFTEGAGRDELTFLLASHVRQICQHLGIPFDPRLAQVQTIGEKALSKRDEVEAATTTEELDGIVWEDL
jgi:hypothetical protein